MVVVAMQMWPGRPLILTALKLKWQKGHHLQKKTISNRLDNTLLKKKGLPALSLNKFKTILVFFDIGESAEKNWINTVILSEWQ